MHLTHKTLAYFLGLILVFTSQISRSDETSLYSRLGGIYPIATVVDDFVEHVLANKTLNSNPALAAARQRVAKAGLKFQVTSFVAMATGGPEKYNGRSMVETHKNLNISEKEWQVMVQELKKTLAKFKVPVKEQQDLLALIGTTKADIVTHL